MTPMQGRGRRGYYHCRRDKRWAVVVDRRDVARFRTEREAWDLAKRLGVCTLDGSFEDNSIEARLPPAVRPQDPIGDPVLWFHDLGQRALGGEHRFFVAMLEQAIRDLEHPSPKISRSAREWIADPDDNDTRAVGFDALCAVLRLDAQAVREGLLSARRAA